MRIALVIERMDPTRGGREASTAEVALALVHHGCSVTILCQSATWTAAGVRVRPLGARGAGRTHRLCNFVKRVNDEVARGTYDVVHTTLPMPGADVYQLRSGTMPASCAANLRRRGRIQWPAAKVAQACNIYRRYLARMERQLIERGQTFCLAVSQMVARELEYYFGRRDRVRVIYNAVADSARDNGQWRMLRSRQRAALQLRQKDLLFLTVAKNFELKGVAETIRAFAQWRAPRTAPIGARLLVIGQENPRAYRLFAERLGVGRSVTFLPPSQDMDRWYAAADVCVLLSWYDPCSRVVLEATRRGIPSITTAFNGASEALAGGAGVVVPSPHAGRAIVAALDELADPQKRAARARACLQVANQLGTNRHVEQLLEVYAEVLGQPARIPRFPLSVVTEDEAVSRRGISVATPDELSPDLAVPRRDRKAA